MAAPASADPLHDEQPDLPRELDRGRHVDLRGRRHEPYGRRVVIVALAAVAALALANVFGETATRTSVANAAAQLTVDAPHRLRGGLFFQGRIDVVARRTIAHPTLVLGRGWLEQMQINTIEPSPKSESSDGAELELEFTSLHAGQRLTLVMQFEANPLATGRRDQSVAVRDGERELARVHRTVTTFP